jgi:hypothetical protein
LGRIRADARTGLYALTLAEPPVFDRCDVAAGVSAHAGDDPFREELKMVNSRTELTAQKGARIYKVGNCCPVAHDRQMLF